MAVPGLRSRRRLHGAPSFSQDSRKPMARTGRRIVSDAIGTMFLIMLQSNKIKIYAKSRNLKSI
jgi:hypothetical protein